MNRTLLARVRWGNLALALIVLVTLAVLVGFPLRGAPAPPVAPGDAVPLAPAPIPPAPSSSPPVPRTTSVNRTRTGPSHARRRPSRRRRRPTDRPTAPRGTGPSTAAPTPAYVPPPAAGEFGIEPY